MDPIERTLFRHSHLVDPTLHIWGWQIPVYLFLGGLAAGLLIVCGALRLRAPWQRSRVVRFMPFGVPIVLSIGMLALLLDLEHGRHVYRFYTAFRPTSPMSWGAWLLVAIYPASLAFGLADLDGDDVARIEAMKWLPERARRALLGWQRRSSDHAEMLARLNVGLGIVLGAYTGILLGTLGARAAYNSVMLAPLFLVSGVSTAAALMMLFPVSPGEHVALRRWDILAIGVEIIVLALLFIGFAGAGAAGQSALALFFGGDSSVAFWSLVVVSGLLIPATLEIVEARRKLRPTALAPVLALAGGLALRFIVVLAGQS